MKPNLTFIYDGQCPFCNHFAELLELKSNLSNLQIQNARQKIIQKLKEAEAKVIYEEFKSRQGELVNGIVRRISKGTIIVDIGRTEAIIPYEEQVPREYFQPKDRFHSKDILFYKKKQFLYFG